MARLTHGSPQVYLRFVHKRPVHGGIPKLWKPGLRMKRFENVSLFASVQTGSAVLNENGDAWRMRITLRRDSARPRNNNDRYLATCCLRLFSLLQENVGLLCRYSLFLIKGHGLYKQMPYKFNSY